jgi:hypothetical protein
VRLDLNVELPTIFPDLPWYGYLLWQALALAVGWIYCSFAEWILHRCFMHTKFIPRFPFTAHALVHHTLFRADKSYHASTEEQMKHVSFNWWDHLTLIAIQATLFGGVELLIGLPILIGATLSVVTYLLAYEGIHYVFHVPKDRFFERHAWFRWLKHHHWIHHRQQFRNMNVVLPLADFVLRTRRGGLKEEAAAVGIGGGRSG